MLSRFRGIDIMTVLIWLCLALPGASDNQSFAVFRYKRLLPESQCLDGAAVQDTVSAKLGYDPWREEAPLHIDAMISVAEDVLTANIRFMEEDGTLLGERVIRSKDNNCYELMNAMALAISIAIDPLSVSGLPEKNEEVIAPIQMVDDNEPEPVTETPMAPPREKEKPPEETAGPSSERYWNLSLHLGGFVSWRSGPSVTGGVDGGLRIKWKRFSFAVAGRFDLPSTIEVNPGKVRTSQFMGQCVSCVHYSYATACGLFSGGVLKAEGEGLENSKRDILPSLWAGARLGAEIPVGSVVILRPYVDFLAALVRNSLVETSTQYEFWRTPPFSMAFGFSVEATFY